VERIQGIRNAIRTLPSVERAAVARRIERHDPREEERQEPRKRRRRPPEDGEPPAGPDADGHIDITV